MGTWRWFSVEHCEAASSCVVVDAWLQLFLCLAASLFVLLLFVGCCLGRRVSSASSSASTASSAGPDSFSQRFWSTASFSPTASFAGGRVPFFSFFLWGGAARTRSKTAPMPLAVIQKDADEANITSHKNSLKQASEFMRQTQRISRTDFATQDRHVATAAGGGDGGHSLSFMGRLGGSFSASRRLSGEKRRVSDDRNAPRSDTIPIRKRSGPLPLSRSSTSRRGSVNTSSLEMDAVLSAAAGMHATSHRRRQHDDGTDDDDDDAHGDGKTRRASAPSSSSRGTDRASSFRKRLTNVLTPSFLRGLHPPRPSSQPSGSSGDTTAAKKKAPRERSATTFEEPSYRTRQKLAALPLEHRKKKERRGSVELRDKRRLSVGREAQIQFEVSDGNEASVYEVKLKEITLVKRLAFGPLSEVYAAIWRDTKVGVKLLMPREGVTDKLEEAVKNFRREIWVMGALKHPNIVKLIGASLTPTCYVLVMEYMSNGSLYEYLRDEANFFPHQMVLTSALDIADGMRHIHASGVLQRDLKSKNCLVSENLVVKVADFGLSRFVSKSEQYTFVGTPFWAAPEVIRHEPYDEKADVYSFAIVLWELVERKDPYETVNAFQVPLQVANDGLRPSDFSRSAPLGLEQLMKQCWDANPDQRPSFDDIAETLQKWLEPPADGDDSGRRAADSDGDGDDLSAHVQRERHCANESQLNRFASSHDANAKAIPIVLSRGKTDRSMDALHMQRRSSAVAMAAMLPRPHSDRSISRVSNHSAP